MKKIILSICALSLVLSTAFIPARASTYVSGFNDGKKSGYELGLEVGYDSGYNDRDRQAKAETVKNTATSIAISATVSVLVVAPLASGITAYFVSRKRDKNEKELQLQNEALKLDILRLQNRIIFDMQQKSERT